MSNDSKITIERDYLKNIVTDNDIVTVMVDYYRSSYGAKFKLMTGIVHGRWIDIIYPLGSTKVSPARKKLVHANYMKFGFVDIIENEDGTKDYDIRSSVEIPSEIERSIIEYYKCNQNY